MPRPSQVLLSLRRALPALLAAAALAVAAYWSLRLAYADHGARQGGVEAVRRAIRMAPGDARNYRQWAAREPGQAIPALEATVALNPRDSAAWVELGLAAEARSDHPRAERCLLEAARVDRMLEPRWTLANYYFRRRRAEPFWRWAGEAAAMTYDDAAPLLRLCWEMQPQPELILARVVGADAWLLRQFLGFLLARNHLEGAEPVAQRLVSRAGPEALPALLAYCDRLLGAGRAEPALRVWNGLTGKRLIGFAPLAPDGGAVLTNGDFSAPPLGRGFDWRLAPLEGVAAARAKSPPAMRFSTSGRQPADCELMSQFLPLQAGQSYRLSYRYRTAGIAAGSGLGWQVAGASSAPLASQEWKEEAVEFAAPAGGLARLALVYHRAPGTTRIEGTLWISQVKVDRACPAPTS